MLRAVSALALATAATIAAPGVPAAQAASVCVENNQLTFDKPLTTEMRSGIVQISYQGTCPDLPGLTPRHYDGGAPLDYFGSCVITFLGEGGTSVIVGGTLYAFVRDGVQVKVEVLQSETVCPTTYEHGTGVISTLP